MDQPSPTAAGLALVDAPMSRDGRILHSINP